MFLTHRSLEVRFGLWLASAASVVACSLQMPSEADIFAAAGSTPVGSGGEPGIAGDGGREDNGGSESSAGDAGAGSVAHGASGASGTGGTKGSGGVKGSGGASGGSSAGGAHSASGGSSAGGAHPTAGAGGTGTAGASGTNGSGGSAGFDPTAGLVAYFTFDETSGTTAANSKDSSKSAKCFGTCSRTTGQIGGAFGLRNNVSPTDWVELPSGIFSGRSAITFSLWMRDLSTNRNGAPLFHFSTSADEAIYLRPDDNQTSGTGAHLVGLHNGASFVDLSSTSPSLTDKSWHQVVISWSSAKVELFIDGNSVASVANPKVVPSQLGASSTNYLGRARDDNSLALFGEVDDLRVYDRVLSATDVKLLYKVR